MTLIKFICLGQNCQRLDCAFTPQMGYMVIVLAFSPCGMDFQLTAKLVPRNGRPTATTPEWEITASGQGVVLLGPALGERLLIYHCHADHQAMGHAPDMGVQLVFLFWPTLPLYRPPTPLPPPGLDQAIFPIDVDGGII